MKKSLALILFAAACAEDGSATPDQPDAANGADAAPLPDGAAGARIGHVVAREITTLGKQGDYQASTVNARFSQSGFFVWHREVMAEGACRLLRYEPGNCSACDGVCLAPAECHPYPTNDSAGTLTVEGLRASVSFQFDEYIGYWVDAALPPDLFDAGATVRAGATGADVGGFTLSAAAVPPLVAPLPVDGNGILALPGDDFTITWTPADGPARVRLALHSATQGHGLPSTAVIECESADSGTLTVPGALLAAFPTGQVGPICVGIDCPPSRLARSSLATAASGTGHVALEVESAIDFYIRR